MRHLSVEFLGKNEGRTREAESHYLAVGQKGIRSPLFFVSIVISAAFLLP